MRKRKVLLSALLVFILVLSGLVLYFSFCAPSATLFGQTDAKTSQVSVLLMQPANTEPLTAFLQAAAQKQNIALDFSTVPEEEYMELLRLRMSAGNGPDILELNESWVAAYAQQGWLYDISGVLDEHFFAPLPAQTLEMSESFSKRGIYSVPAGISTVRLLLNSEIFDALSLKAPESFTDMLSCARTIHARTDASGFAVIGRSQWTGQMRLVESALSAQGDTFFDEQSDRVDLTIYAPWNLMLRQMRESGCVLEGGESLSVSEALTAFSDGKIGFMLVTSSDLAALADMDCGVPYSIHLPPTVTGTVTSPRELLRTGYFAVNAASANKPAAVRLWQSFYSVDGLTALAASGKLLMAGETGDSAGLPAEANPTRNETCFAPIPATFCVWNRADAAEIAFQDEEGLVLLRELTQKMNERIK